MVLTFGCCRNFHGAASGQLPWPIRGFISSAKHLGLSLDSYHHVTENATPSISDNSVLITNKAEAAGRVVKQGSLPTTAYIHLPFCKRRCFYCDFAIIAVGDGNSESNARHIECTMSRYVELVCTEVISTFKALPSCQVRPLKTLFFGGGTPSLMPSHLLKKIIDTVHQCCGFEPEVELSMELDPGTFDRASLRDYMDCGLNRASLGVQAFQDNLLKACGRSHGLGDVHDAIHILQMDGPKNWSLDLMSSLPHQTLAAWEESLQCALQAQPAHISVYDLQIEEGTKFGQWFRPGKHPLPSDEFSAELYKTASSSLRAAGYNHYEISNYAKPGYECRHNLVYWQNLSYYAFGLGATSYVHGKRFSRPKKWKDYATFVESHQSHKQEPSADISVEDELSDIIMLSLRLARGIDLNVISQKFGTDVCLCICKTLLPFVSSGHVSFLNVNNQPLTSKLVSSILAQDRIFGADGDLAFVRLTDPEGFLLSNEVIASVFSMLPKQ